MALYIFICLCRWIKLVQLLKVLKLWKCQSVLAGVSWQVTEGIPSSLFSFPISRTHHASSFANFVCSFNFPVVKLRILSLPTFLLGCQRWVLGSYLDAITFSTCWCILITFLPRYFIIRDFELCCPSFGLRPLHKLMWSMHPCSAKQGQIKTGAPCRSERLAKYNQVKLHTHVCLFSRI